MHGSLQGLEQAVDVAGGWGRETSLLYAEYTRYRLRKSRNSRKRRRCPGCSGQDGLRSWADLRLTSPHASGASPLNALTADNVMATICHDSGHCGLGSQHVAANQTAVVNSFEQDIDQSPHPLPRHTSAGATLVLGEVKEDARACGCELRVSW